MPEDSTRTDAAASRSTPPLGSVMDGLKYIASSPLPEHGGFHPQTVEIALDALDAIHEWMRLADQMNKALDCGKREVCRQIAQNAYRKLKSKYSPNTKVRDEDS